MTRLVGHSGILVALALAFIGAIAAFVTAARHGRASTVARSIAYVNGGLLLVANLAMIVALVTNDFSVSYVAQVGSRSTPLLFSIISLWGALEGSILFWAGVLAAYTAAVVFTSRRRDDAALGYATGVLHAVCLFFFILLVGPANPFGTVFPIPQDGPGPNPLLQNHILMAIHPPLLYLGYVGLTVPFAFAMGALLSGTLDAEWSRATRKWTVTAWGFLTAAIIAGMWWSYEVLGWGGYWAWDPVENASFMPWLTATAFIHSTMVEERRGMLKGWNVTLVIATFLLTILGTFLTRSGVLSSVHAFAGGNIGYYFLSFIAVVLVASLVVLAGKGQALKSEARLESPASRETVFLVNNLLFTVFTFTVLLGTLYPLVAEAIRGVKVSVGAPFFNQMTLPLCMALLFLLGVGPALPWRRAEPAELKRRLLAPAIALVASLVLALVLGERNVYAVVGFAFVGFALVGNAQEYVLGARARMRSLGENAGSALVRAVAANRRRYGGYLAHMGVLVATAGIIASSADTIEREKTLRAGETLTVGRYTVRYDETWGRKEPQRFVVGATVRVIQNGAIVDSLTPRMNFYNSSAQPIATPAVRSSARDDLYLTLMAFEQDGSKITLKVLVEPLVVWIWVGGLVVLLGVVVAVWPSNRRPTPAGPRPTAQRPAAVGRRPLADAAPLPEPVLTSESVT
ncbi:MAG TPA: heme lyase CcmF/NrfE family subunit [Gemmatimonadaceae bacterium]|nr:heme lyase CcmF/NrfE family subunit [Gemmatimonadaceae bacterium]